MLYFVFPARENLVARLPVLGVHLLCLATQILRMTPLTLAASVPCSRDKIRTFPARRSLPCGKKSTETKQQQQQQPKELAFGLKDFGLNQRITVYLHVLF